MIRRSLRPVLALLAFAAVACDRAPAIEPSPNFPKFTNWVVDQADVLPPAEEARLTAAAAALQHEVGPQFAIVTVPSLEGRTIENYSVHLARTWGVGSKKRNDGLVMIVAPNERQVRIEVGYELEQRVTDPFAARVLRESVLPRFREGNLVDGIKDGSARLIGRLRSKASDRDIAAEDGVVS